MYSRGSQFSKRVFKNNQHKFFVELQNASRVIVWLESSGAGQLQLNTREGDIDGKSTGKWKGKAKVNNQKNQGRKRRVKEGGKRTVEKKGNRTVGKGGGKNKEKKGKIGGETEGVGGGGGGGEGVKVEKEKKGEREEQVKTLKKVRGVRWKKWGKIKMQGPKLQFPGLSLLI